jgi:hypothetical protein
VVPDAHGLATLEAVRNKNIDLLLSTGKDLDLVEGVYGKAILKKQS